MWQGFNDAMMQGYEEGEATRKTPHSPGGYSSRRGCYTNYYYNG